ncbi:MAG TPA: DUF4430 domain-containing protein [Bacilli bacterium]
MKKALLLLLLFAFVFFTACKGNDESGSVRIVIENSESTVLFDGVLDFTKNDTLIGLLQNHEEIRMRGETSQYGLYITELCGVKAENAYWAIYVDGEYAMVGVSDIPLKENAEIRFILTPIE